MNEPNSALFESKALSGQFACVWHLRTHDEVVSSSNVLCQDVILIVFVIFASFVALSRRIAIKTLRLVELRARSAELRWSRVIDSACSRALFSLVSCDIIWSNCSAHLDAFSSPFGCSGGLQVTIYHYRMIGSCHLGDARALLVADCVTAVH